MVVVVTHPAVELFATIDDCYFAVAAPHTWNKLPEETVVAFSFQATFKNLQSTARWRHPLLVVVTWDLPTLASSSFHARGQVTATVVLPFMVSSCEILCHATCGQLTYPWPHSEIDWKHSCLMLTRSSAFAALASLGYISDIIIIFNCCFREMTTS